MNRGVVAPGQYMRANHGRDGVSMALRVQPLGPINRCLRLANFSLLRTMFFILMMSQYLQTSVLVGHLLDKRQASSTSISSDRILSACERAERRQPREHESQYRRPSSG